MVARAPDTGKSTCRYRCIAPLPPVQVPLDWIWVSLIQVRPPPWDRPVPPQRPGDEARLPGDLFIGQASPVGAILEVAVGCRVLVDIALSLGCTRVVVNTSGLMGTGA
jgi:hypothetical protein